MEELKEFIYNIDNKELNIKLKRSHGMPCSLDTFLINDCPAYEDNFGEGRDDRDYPGERPDYGCVHMIWERDNSNKKMAMTKYNLTSNEFDKVCDVLENYLYVGCCGWCS